MAKWKQICQSLYPDLHPTRPGGFQSIPGGVLILGHDEKVVMIVRGKSDLTRLNTMVQLAMLDDESGRKVSHE